LDGFHFTKEEKMMKHKILRRFLIGLIVLALLVPMSGAGSEAMVVSQEKNETVYILTDTQGKILEERDVQWYRDINGKSQNKDKGKIDKALPFALAIEYFYNDKLLNPSEFLGKKGILKTQVKIQNLTGKSGDVDQVPFIVQLSLSIDLEQYRDIKAGDAYSVITGNKLNLSFSSVLLDQIQWEWSAQSDNIEFDSMMFTILPKLPAIPDYYRQSKVFELMDRMNQLRSKLPDINPLTQSIQIASESQAGIDTLTANHQALTKGFKEIHSNIKTSQASLSLFSRGIQMLKTDTDYFTDNMGSLNNQLQEMNTRQEKIKVLAQSVQKNNSPGSEAYKLAQLILDQSSEISDLSDECNSFNKSQVKIKTKTESLATTFSGQFQVGAKKLEDSLRLFETSSEQIDTGMILFQKGIHDFTSKIGIFKSFQSLISDLKQLSEDGNKEIQTQKNYITTLNQSANTYSFLMQNDSSTESHVQFLIKTSSLKKGIEKSKVETEPILSNPGPIIKCLTWIKNLLHFPSSVK
jgi:hypothetical protein